MIPWVTETVSQSILQTLKEQDGFIFKTPLKTTYSLWDMYTTVPYELETGSFVKVLKVIYPTELTLSLPARL